MKLITRNFYQAPFSSAKLMRGSWFTGRDLLLVSLHFPHPLQNTGSSTGVVTAKSSGLQD